MRPYRGVPRDPGRLEMILCRIESTRVSPPDDPRSRISDDPGREAALRPRRLDPSHLARRGEHGLNSQIAYLSKVPHRDIRAGSEIAMREPLLTTRDLTTLEEIALPSFPHAPQPSVRWLSGDMLLDDIALHEKVGEGGMGVVYRASNVVTNEQIAVKRVRPSALPADRELLTNFYAELVSWLDAPSHAHLLSCRFFRIIGGELAIFTDFMSGGSLLDRLRGSESFALSDAIVLAVEVASAAAALHEQGLVHQDIRSAADDCGRRLPPRPGRRRCAARGLPY
jgi:hypothetical protein